MRKIRVLVIDDSALVRRMLTEFLDADPDLEVIGSAADPFVARAKIKALHPDVLTLDIEMPRMDGLTFLAHLMRLHPLPVVMVSSLKQQGAASTLQALELGAVDFVGKPRVDVAHTLKDYAEEIALKVKTAARARLQAREQVAADTLRATGGLLRFRTTDRLIAIGASTGGTEAIRELLTRLPAASPAVVITQHIPAAFSGPFAARMNDCCAMTVSEAKHDEKVLPGHVYIAPGGRHLEIVRDGARWRCRVDQGPPVNRHCPSVDVMFRSIARSAGPNAVGIILTGMGADGAEGLLELKRSGAPTLAQDEATSVVWGMPGAAVKLGAVDHVLPLTRIPDHLQSLLGGE